MSSSKMEKPISVFFIAPAPIGISPGQRFRFEQYLPLLEQHAVKYKVSAYYSLSGRKALYSRNKLLGKILAIVRGYFIRFFDLFSIWRYNYVYIHREEAPLGPPIFPWIISKVFRKKIVYDFDDAIWIPGVSDYNKKFGFVKFFGNVSKICKWSHKVSVGNAYLRKFAENYNKDVRIIPTVVNTEMVHSRLQDQQVNCPNIGWTGSFSTLQYLQMVVPILQELQEKYEFTFFVIADRDPKLPLKRYQFIRWNKETEVQDLLKFHIGLMPLTDDDYSRGKCGFKAIQYMSLGMPALVSPVGVNTEIVNDGVDGYICEKEEDWKDRIEKLLKDADLRMKIGKSARAKIEKSYSIAATRNLFLELFTPSKTNGLTIALLGLLF
jgi:glycosyltransferase involved in cell wall biosynthesis